MKSITLKKSGYIVKGVSDLTMWGGGNGCIVMEPFKLKKITKKNILNNLNDNGFGVQSINGAIVNIYENFNGYEVFLKQMVVGKINQNTVNYFFNYE